MIALVQAFLLQLSVRLLTLCSSPLLTRSTLALATPEPLNKVVERYHYVSESITHLLPAEQS
jgi:hypothetical protein